MNLDAQISQHFQLRIIRVKILQSTKAMKRSEYEWMVTKKTTLWLKEKFELQWNAPIKNAHLKKRDFDCTCTPYIQRKCIQEFKQNSKNCSPIG